MELQCWAGERKWDLPSFDIASLHAMAFIKFSKVDVSIKVTQRCWISKKGLQGNNLPCLITANQEKIGNLNEMFQYLRLKHYNPDTWMSHEALQQMLPLKALIEDKLNPAVISLFWLDSSNYTEVTRGLYAKSCQYPLNFSVPQKIRQEQEEYVKQFKGFTDEEMVDVTSQLHSDAALLLNQLSALLGANDFLFGSRPSSVDALLFSCLAPLLKIPLQNNKLQNHLKGCANICQYINRVLQKYFKDESASDASKALDQDDDEKYDWVFPVCVATVAMASYALNAGLIQTTRV